MHLLTFMLCLLRYVGVQFLSVQRTSHSRWPSICVHTKVSSVLKMNQIGRVLKGCWPAVECGVSSKCQHTPWDPWPVCLMVSVADTGACKSPLKTIGNRKPKELLWKNQLNGSIGQSQWRVYWWLAIPVWQSTHFYGHISAILPVWKHQIQFCQDNTATLI